MMKGQQSSIRLLLCSIAVLLLSSCGPSENDPGPGGVSAGDAAALDKAAQKLDERDKVSAPPDAQ
jgi:hypothetical protein